MQHSLHCLFPWTLLSSQNRKQCNKQAQLNILHNKNTEQGTGVVTISIGVSWKIDKNGHILYIK